MTEKEPEQKLIALYDKLMTWDKRDLVESFIQCIPDNEIDYYLNESED